MSPDHAGRLIVLEGIDGSGKSTAISGLAERFEAQGDAVWVTAEETDTWRGEAVRRSIAEGQDPWTTLHLFLADRAAHVPEMQSHLEAGETVLCDRFMHSTLAYQSVTLGPSVPDVTDHLRRLHEPWCIAPDDVVLLDIEAEVALERVHGRGDATPYEKLDFLDRVRSAYLRLADSDGFHVVDAAQAPDGVVEGAWAALNG